MSRIKVLETFSGIGAQAKAIANFEKGKKKFFEIVATIDWDARSIITYAQIHHNVLSDVDKILKKNQLSSAEKINFFLKKFELSLDSKRPSQITRKDLTFKKILVASIIKSNNLGSITNLKLEEINRLAPDFVTYSFPCQGLSIANMGRANGIFDKNSTSSLIWNVYSLIKGMKTKPKYLLMENVPNLISKKFINQYEKWKETLENEGYKTFTAILNGLNFGSIQKRNRVFAVSFLKEIKTPFANDLEFKKYILNLGQDISTDFDKRKQIFQSIFNFDSNNSENAGFLINATPSRIRMAEKVEKINESKNFIIRTLTTKQDRNPNTGIIKLENNLEKKLNYRFISNREAFSLMGFENSDFEKLGPLISKNILTKESLYRQARKFYYSNNFRSANKFNL
ncbi:DNA cytosine methyltransferase [Mesomycoplasma ovipneumoniae]|uniref:DNA cytosine methyltransferase n=1 Tax=Mesomycoplasma ovipneumoniae TaxID=29562 RepID=UPI0028A6A6BD|nr:DNA cytosine methyltransferase [Mesomycoplasma ovipneumoniae]MDW2933283.1 DNA cytosine methyltransferase [Mesomycoplasma ovipneumoniae]WNM16054.1 DNA cytosine methyltransferase [Mesomycoplasma ovipneumoniae]